MLIFCLSSALLVTIKQIEMNLNGLHQVGFIDELNIICKT